MAVSPDYLDYINGLFCEIGAVRTKHMFGGVGIYLDGLFCALIAANTLYLKVDESNRADFEACGMAPFRPYPDKPAVMGYYEVPAEVLEDSELFRQWALKAHAVALAARTS